MVSGLSQTGADQGSQAEILCGLVLELAGRSAGRMASARRHVQVLEAAFDHMNKSQRAEARRRIDALETRWGPMLPGDQNEPENGGFPPVMRVARWLSTRKTPERLLRVLHRAASKFADGETCLSAVMDYAFARETDHVLIPVGFDSFKEWMLELRIAKRAGKGVYVPGPLSAWWVREMLPSKDKLSAYQACLKQAAQVGRKPRSFY